MKLVFLAYLHGFGGAERQIVMLANAMAERGHDVALISISQNNNCYRLDQRVCYQYIPDRTTSWLRIFTRFRDIKDALANLKPDVTVSFWFQSAYFTAIMRKSVTGKVIYSERGDPGDKEYTGILGIIRRFTLPRIDGFVFQSKGAQSFFNKQVQRRSVIIPNPVFLNCNDFPEVCDRRKAIVAVGRLHPQKNHLLLINAFSLISGDYPDYSLEIYGDGELEHSLQKEIMRLGLSNRIFLLGTSKEIHQLIYNASLFVLSSDYEGLPNTLIEAMALGLPCISTDCKPGGAREIIQNRENGLIVPINSVKDLASAMIELLSNPELAEKYGKKAKSSAKKFDKDVIYNEWERFLRSI